MCLASAEAGYTDPPADMEMFMGPAALAAYPAAAAADDPAVADGLLARALAVGALDLPHCSKSEPATWAGNRVEHSAAKGVLLSKLS